MRARAHTYAQESVALFRKFQFYSHFTFYFFPCVLYIHVYVC